MNLNWEAIREALPLYVEGAKLTLLYGSLGFLFSLVVGLILSLVHYFRVPILRQMVSAYIEVSRNTPLLIQLFFLYYGLPKIGLVLSKEVCGIVGLTFLGSSYMSESFRLGLESVSKNQIDSGKALGFSYWQLAYHIILPQAFTVSLPSLGANGIFLLKETSIFSAIAIMELMNTATSLIGMYYRSNEYLLLVIVFYTLILLPFTLTVTWIERRTQNGFFRS